MGRAVLSLAAAVLVASLVTGACSLPSGPVVDGLGSPAGQRLDTPPGFLTGAAWLPDGRLYFGRSEDLVATLELWAVVPGSPAEKVPMPDADGCRRTEYRLPTALPDGRLGLVRDCTADDPHQSRLDLVAADPRSGEVEVLVPLGRRNPSAVSWQHDLRNGFVSYSGGVCSGIAPFTRTGIGSLPGPVTLDGRTWRLDEIFTQPPGADCSGQGRADQALITLDGRRLVFLASPDSQGASGQARLDRPWRLFVQDLPGGPPREIVGGFDDHRGMALSPDGLTVALSGRRGDENGVWLVDVETGAMRSLAAGRYGGPSFSPDGRRVAAVLRHDEDHSELRVLDLPATGAGG